MPYTYDTYKAAISELMATQESAADFVAILPSIIDYAEQRMYRELDLLSTVIMDASASLVASNRNFTLPSSIGTFVVTNGVNIITPAGTGASTGSRVPLTPVSRDVLDLLWPSSTSNTAQPEVYAMVTDQTIAVGPSPDAAYVVEVKGTVRPAPLSATNSTTYLSLYLPDVFVAASMVFASGFMRNFGSQADDPKMAQSWETQYQTLFASANVEEQRKRYASSAWGSLQPTPIATPNR